MPVVNLLQPRPARKRQARRRAAKVENEEPRSWRRDAQGKRATADSSTECWSKSTPMSEYPAERWASWTRSSTISSSVSLVKHRDWPTTTSERPSRLAKSKLQSDFCCLESSPSTPWAKVPKLWRSTPAPSDSFRANKSNGFFKATNLFKTFVTG